MLKTAIIKFGEHEVEVREAVGMDTFTRTNYWLDSGLYEWANEQGENYFHASYIYATFLSQLTDKGREVARKIGILDEGDIKAAFNKLMFSPEFSLGVSQIERVLNSLYPKVDPDLAPAVDPND